MRSGRSERDYAVQLKRLGAPWIQSKRLDCFRAKRKAVVEKPGYYGAEESNDDTA